jgi:hypothetical protein
MDWALSWAASTPPITPVHACTLGAGGGGLSFGVGSRDVGIVQLEVKEQGRTFCGGSIGIGRKMCVGVNCKIEGHKTKKVDLSMMVGWCLPP